MTFLKYISVIILLLIALFIAIGLITGIVMISAVLWEIIQDWIDGDI